MKNLFAVLNGPFETHIFIDVHAIRSIKEILRKESFNETYCRLQKKAFDHLKKKGCSDWKSPALKHRTAVDYDTDDFAGVPISPDCFLECDLSISTGQIFHGPSIEGYNNEYKITSAKITLHDFGIGIVTLRIESPSSSEPEIFRADIESINANIASFIVKLIEPKLDEFNACIAALVQNDNGSKIQHEVETIGRKPLKLMWIHRIYIAECDEESFAQHVDLANLLLVKHHLEDFKDSSIEPGWKFYPSIGSSLAMFNLNQALPTGLTKLNRMISLHNAYNAAIWMLDDILFNQILNLRSEQMKLSEKKIHLKEIEKHAYTIFSISSHISEFLAVFKNRISRLSPQETILSETLCYAWRFEFQIRALEEKLNSLKEMYQITMKLVSDAEARLLNKIVFLFTIISFITFSTAVVDFITQPEEFKFSLWRVWCLALSIIGVAIFGILILVKQFGWSARITKILKREGIDVE